MVVFALGAKVYRSAFGIRGHRGRWWVAGILATCAVALSAQFGDRFQDVRQLSAGNVVSLAGNALVVTERQDDWDGDGEVVFRMPADRTPRDNMGVIWRRNGLNNETDAYAVRTAEAWSLKKRNGTAVTLRYDPGTGLYTYTVVGKNLEGQ
jgi:hypothetical protein